MLNTIIIVDSRLVGCWLPSLTTTCNQNLHNFPFLSFAFESQSRPTSLMAVFQEKL